MNGTLAALARDRRAAVGGALLVGMAAAALAAPWLAPFDPIAQGDVVQTRLLPPFAVAPDGGVRPLGTDQLGRDVLSRMLYGARISMAVRLPQSLFRLKTAILR